jgi:hypothetical protein
LLWLVKKGGEKGEEAALGRDEIDTKERGEIKKHAHGSRIVSLLLRDP